MIIWFAAFAFLLALLPALLFLQNLKLYRTLPPASEKPLACSILLPVRNEETNIADALKSILASTGVTMEVIVLDDGSDDQTASIVGELTAETVRLEKGRPLPPGWCGKNFACQQLAELAKHPVLVFMDADVRVSQPDSISRLVEFLSSDNSSLVSGVPLEKAGTLAEKLIIPLIHFVLLGFLPIQRMRASADARFAAACGQILAVRKEAYARSGGHAAIPNQIHDAVALTRSFRKAGFSTDLFDATDTFTCRMYRGVREVWNGFAKNAHEGLGAPRLIVPATILLLGGHVIPFLLLPFAKTTAEVTILAVAIVVAYLPRFLAAYRFNQSWLSACLHPLGVSTLVAIQWTGLFRALRRRPAAWKGRTYSPAAIVS